MSSTCRVSFTDSIGVSHTATVSASSLFEAAALAIATFRRCGFTEGSVGPGTRLISVDAPSTTHELPVSKLHAWLQGSGRTPQEQAMKANVRQFLGLTLDPERL